MDEGLKPTYEKIMEGTSAEEVFGVTDVFLATDKMLEFLEKEYQVLKSVTSATWNDITDHECAKDADMKLEEFYAIAKERLEEGVFGLKVSANIPRNLPSFRTSKRKYFIGPIIAKTDTYILYQCYCEYGSVAGEVLIKLPRKLSNNDLIQNELRVLRELWTEREGALYKHLPRILDTFRTEGRTGIILRVFDGFSLLDVRNNPLYRKGVPQKHMVWMLNRALAQLVSAHDDGVINGNLSPATIRIRPHDHNLCITDWSCGAISPAITGDKYLTYDETYSAPEIKKGVEPNPASDIYSLGKIMIWVLGGNPKTNEFPDDVEDKLVKFLRGFVLDSAKQRPSDARQLHTQLRKIIIRLWGEPKFLNFPMS